jgi:deoxyribonuclease-4
MSSIYPKIGMHRSAAGDITQAPWRAHSIGCECFQFFSRPPQGGPAKKITAKIADDFKTNCKKYKVESYIHSPYYINLASVKNNIYFGSIKVLRDELERGSQLGVRYMMAHLGSAKDLGEKEGLKKCIDGLAQILDGYQGSTEFLIEMSAGAGAVIGATFEMVAKIVESPKLKKYNIGICYDTCHGFASGYDMRDKKSTAATFKKFNNLLSLKRLKLIHANDSATELGSHKDRHAHIGAGYIGLEGFKKIIALAKKQKINLILETPKDGRELEDIKILKKIRK